MYDYIAQVLNDAQPLIQQLSEQEQLVVDARKSRDKNLQLQAEDKCRELRKQLLKSENTVQEASFYFHFLATEVANSDEFRSAWQNMALSVDELARLRQWNLEKFYKDNWHAPTPDLSLLPPYSFFLQFTFTLAKPYISRDDNLFYIIDNPIVRDKVFGLPMVRPTAWKGNLYSALWQMGHDKQDDEQMQRLFGETRSEESGQAGRLYFYPTFFTQTGLEIINPHDRKRRVGKNPILFESVPAGASGTFSLLYVPLDLIGQDPDSAKDEAGKHLRYLAPAIRELFLTYGFSAKRTSGYGVAKDEIKGKVQTRAGEKSLNSLENLAQEVKDVAF